MNPLMQPPPLAPNQLSFLPDDYLDRKAQRRTNLIFAALFVVVSLVVASAFVLTERANRETERRHAEVQQQYAEAARRIEQVRQMQDKQRRVAHQAELAASLLERVPRGNILAELTNSLPKGVSLLDFVMESKKKAPPAQPAAKTAFEQKAAAEKKAATPTVEVRQFDVIMKVTGVAQTDVQVAQFINSLGRSPLLSDVNLVVSEEHAIGPDRVRRFQLEATLDPNAQVVPPQAAVKTPKAAGMVRGGVAGAGAAPVSSTNTEGR